MERQMQALSQLPARAISTSRKKQILTCLRLAPRKHGFLSNFGAAVMKEGITRTVNGLDTGR